ncbi:MAG: hypothetical protein ABW007_26395 [Chitinophagaceae bacterium]
MNEPNEEIISKVLKMGLPEKITSAGRAIFAGGDKAMGRYGMAGRKQWMANHLWSAMPGSWS